MGRWFFYEDSADSGGDKPSAPASQSQLLRVLFDGWQVSRDYRLSIRHTVFNH